MKLISHFHWRMKPCINQLNTLMSRWGLKHNFLLAQLLLHVPIVRVCLTLLCHVYSSAHLCRIRTHISQLLLLVASSTASTLLLYWIQSACGPWKRMAACLTEAEKALPSYCWQAVAELETTYFMRVGGRTKLLTLFMAWRLVRLCGGPGWGTL